LFNKSAIKLTPSLDGGQTGGEKASTIIDVTCDPPVILREGAISKKALEAYTRII